MKSTFSGRNKNMDFLLRYGAGSITWMKNEIDEIDIKIRRFAMNKQLYPQQ